MKGDDVSILARHPIEKTALGGIFQSVDSEVDHAHVCYPLRPVRPGSPAKLIIFAILQEFTVSLTDYKQEFLAACMQYGALKFGEFTLKSGRVSPYFFNAGAFNDGQAFALLGQCYAGAIEGMEFDGLFGPAYKGIPLGTALSVALAQQGRNVPVTFNRKEAKDHGEGGLLMGAQPAGRMLLVDDVITAGTAVREAMEQLADVQVSGLVVALTAKSGAKAAPARYRNYVLRADVRTIVTLDDVLRLQELPNRPIKFRQLRRTARRVRV